MNPRFLRIFKKVSFDEVKEHLIICGDLTAQCAHCNEMGLKFDTVHCPNCRTTFKYLAFRKVKENMPKIVKYSETRPDLTIIDFDDFKRIEGAKKAEDVFG